MIRDEHDYNAVLTVLDPHPIETHISIHPNPCAMMLSQVLFLEIPNYTL